MRWGGQGKYSVYTFNTLFLISSGSKRDKSWCCCVSFYCGWMMSAKSYNKWAEEGTRGRNIESKFQVDAIVWEEREREKTHNHICIHIRYIWKEMGTLNIYRWQRMMWNQRKKIFEEGKRYMFFHIFIYIYQDMTKYLQERCVFLLLCLLKRGANRR